MIVTHPELGKLLRDYSPLYSVKKVAAATATGTKISFFQDTAAAIGIQETNMEAAGVINPPGRFEALALRFIMVGQQEEDIEALSKNFAARFTVLGKTRWQGPLPYFAGGGGISGAVATTAAATTVQEWNNGNPDPRAVALVPFEDRVHIEALAKITVDLETGGAGFTTTAAVYIMAILEGFKFQVVN